MIQPPSIRIHHQYTTTIQIETIKQQSIGSAIYLSHSYRFQIDVTNWLLISWSKGSIYRLSCENTKTTTCSPTSIPITTTPRITNTPSSPNCTKSKPRPTSIPPSTTITTPKPWDLHPNTIHSQAGKMTTFSTWTFKCPNRNASICWSACGKNSKTSKDQSKDSSLLV